MKAIQIQNYHIDLPTAIGNLELVNKPIPKPIVGMVLIKVDSAACNPSDLAFLRGIYGIVKDLPVVPGFEGSGTVVESGEDAYSKSLAGKRVSFFSHTKLDGSWAEYVVTDAKLCIPIRPDIPIEQAAGFLVNPYTAYGLLDLAIQKGSKAIIQTAALSQVGSMIQKLAKIDNIGVINIVRKDEQVDYLKNQGEKYVLNSESSAFQDELKLLANDLNATIAFDAVSGDLTPKILHAMPPSSQIVVYGTLSGQGVNRIGARDLIFHRKSVRGFILMEWFEKNTPTKVIEVSEKLQNLIADKQLLAKIQRTISLEEAKEGILQYTQQMSDGKVVFILKS